MATKAGKDFHDELTAWLDMIHAEQTGEGLDQLADLWLANGDAKAIKDKTSPAARDAHAKVDGILTDMGY